MDTSFIDIINEENISKIDIDSRLIEPFKQAMIEIQKYFNEKGYSEEINYKDYLQKYVLNDSNKKLKIRISDIGNASGSYNSYKNTLLVNENDFNNNPYEIAHILCHEFIHFLIHCKQDILYASKWSGETFVDEGYTERLAKEIIPSNGNYYSSIPNLLNFYNELSGCKDNYLLFLQGRLPDLFRQNYYPNSFAINGDNCIEKFEKGYYINGGYETDEDYLTIQRDIIESTIKNEINTYEDFIMLIELLEKRPAIDQEWIVSYVLNKCVNITDDNIKNIILDYTNTLCDLRKYNGEDVYEFNVGEHTLVFTGDRIDGIPNTAKYYFTYKEGKEVLKFIDDQDNIVYFDYKNVDITARRKNLNKKITELTELLENRIKNKEI